MCSTATVPNNAANALDVCGLEPPEPMVRILEALDLLGAGECLHVLIDREPLPLYRVLARNGYQHQAQPMTASTSGKVLWALQIRAAGAGCA
ncbi:MAG: DUF2249 domain-containing protein [Duganella sp.]